MVFGFLNKRLSRKSRAKMVGQLVAALNRFDYEAVERLISPDMKVVDAGGYRLEGAAAVIDADRTFREQADRPQIIVDTLDHWGKGMLLRGHLESPMAEIDGPLMWRIEFTGNRIGLIETTRPLDRVTAPMFASRRSAQAAR